MRYVFGNYELDEHLYELRHAGEAVELERKVYDVLAYLIQHRDRLVTKDELLEKLWPGQVVGEAALTRCITSARKALGDDGNRQEFIKTQYGRGYRFVAAVAAPVSSAECPVPSQQEEVSSLLNQVDNISPNISELDGDGVIPAQAGIQEEMVPAMPSASSWFSWVRRLTVMMLIGTALIVSYLSRPTLSTQSSALSTPAQPVLPLPDKPSIAVLPFTNMSGDPEQEYLSDGLTDDLITDLSRISSLFVIARHSTFTYKNKAMKVQEVSKDLGVRYVLEGSVRRTNDHVRINAQLVDATTGSHLWSERYDRPQQDIFALQDEIRQKIVLALKVQLTPEEHERFQRAPTNNLEAYDYWLRGHELSLRSLQEAKKELNEQARQQYEKAVELDPQYAGAYAWLGWTYFQDAFYLWSKERLQMLDRAFELAQRAVALEDSLSTSHWILGMVFLWQKQHDQAISEGEQAVALDANDADSHVSLGNTLVFAGRSEEGIKLIQKAMRLNPLYPPRYLNLLGLAYRTAGRCEEALVPLKKASTLSPDFGPVHYNLAGCYAELDRLAEARSEIAEILRINPSASLENHRKFMPYKDPAVLERSQAALRKAGLK